MSRKLTEKATNSAFQFKIGELLSRTEYHSKWNNKCDCYGIIVHRTKGLYKVHWLDDHLLGKKTLVYTAAEVYKFKQNLISFLETE